MSDFFAVHDSHDKFFRTPFGAVETGADITIRIRLYAPYTIESVKMRLWQDGLGERKIEMERKVLEDGAQVYSGVLSALSTPGLMWYYFIIKGKGKNFYYGSKHDGYGGIGQLDEYPPRSYQITVFRKGFTTPEWFKDSIMYQIFVDRFFNGVKDSSLLNAKKDDLILKKWHEQPEYKPDPKTGEVLCNDFFGGNLEGIICKLPYLKELGISVLYLNPIFEAYSNHKYDIGDYKSVDPMFGDQKVFSRLCEEAANIGIHVILDGVFSHTGSDSIYFNKKGRYPTKGAYQSKDSPYHKWYRFVRHPDEYECWWGINTLPNVNEMDSSFMDYIIEDEDSVSKYWIKNGARGWRLDVVDELPDAFLKRFRSAVKSADNEAIIIGEVWEDASKKISYDRRREYLLGEELDSVMNYPLRDMIFKFLMGDFDAWQFNRALISLYSNYPKHCFYSLMNVIGTHDVARAMTTLSGAPPDHILTKDEQATFELSSEMIALAKKRLMLACAMQMTMPGVPCIYYGDEAGLSGYRDPFNRGTYPWGNEDKDILAWYKKMTALRSTIDALRTGEFVPLYYDVDVYGYVRYIKGGKDAFGNPRKDGFVLILFNRNQYEKREVKLNSNIFDVDMLEPLLKGEEVLSSKNGKLTLILPSLGTELFYTDKFDIKKS